MPQPEDFMTEPAKVLYEYLGTGITRSEFWWQMGALGIALEVITRIKVLEDLPVTTEVGRQEAITVLQTMLVELGISDLAYEWYERLSAWRRPTFVSEDEVPAALVSAAEARRDALSRLSSTRELPSGRRTLGPGDGSD